MDYDFSPPIGQAAAADQGQKGVLMRVLKIWMAALAFSSAGQALAQQEQRATGFYGSINAGLASVNSPEISYFDQGGTFGGTGPPDSIDFHAKVKNTWTVGGALGYDFGPVRADVEVSYSRNKIKSITLDRVNGQAVTLAPEDRQAVCNYLETDSCDGSGNTFSVSDSRLRQLNALANLWVDLPLGSRITPYAGGGVGVSGLELSGEGKARFAWQLGAGLAVHLSPRLAITGDYRYRQASSIRITDADFPDAGVKIGKLKTNTFTAGLRVGF